MRLAEKILECLLGLIFFPSCSIAERAQLTLLCPFVWHRDFSLIFDTLTQFEETLLQHKIEHGGADEDEPEQANGTDHDDGEDFLLKDDENDIDLRCRA